MTQKTPPQSRRSPEAEGPKTALADTLHERYALPAGDRITSAVWAKASIGALRTAVADTTRNPPAAGAPGTPVADTIRGCLAALTAAPGQAPRRQTG